MHRMVFGILAFTFFGSLAGFAQAADLYAAHRSVRVSQGGDYVDHIVASDPRIRVVEQLPYCGEKVSYRV